MNLPNHQPIPTRLITKLVSTLVFTAIALNVALPTWAGDPFRTSNPKEIGTEAQKAFELMFKDGNYPAASKQIDKALRTEANDPLVQGMKASFAYLEQDYAGMQLYALKTRSAAEKLMATDPLRGNIYMGVSYLIEAGYIVKTNGIVNGAPTALGLVQKLFDSIKAAQAIAPNDPELNLIKGYMDMLIATVLPLSDLENALASLRISSPDYLKWRGIAIGYRDAKNNEKALEAINKAIEAAPKNPELFYLKGQILWAKNDLEAAKKNYREAISKRNQLPQDLVKQINSECTGLTGSSCI
jgi:tetratricopeptide (TPR) repeat protein